MSTKRDPVDLVGRIYDGALNPLLWPDVLEEIAVSFEAICCHFFVGNLARRQMFYTSLNKRFSIERLNDYHEHYRDIDDRLLLSFKKPIGKVYADWELIAPDEFLRTEFYNDFFAPHGLRWSLVGLPVHGSRMTVGFSVHRPPGAEGFERDELSRAQVLFPHLARAARLMRRTAAAGSLAAASAAALDRLRIGIFILDLSGRPLFHNKMAQRLIDRADGLGLSSAGLFASLRDETNGLRRAVRAAATHLLAGGAGTSGGGAGGALTISRESGKRPYQVVVTQLRSDRHPEFPVQAKATVLVIVSDPEAEPAPPEEALARFFGFTAAEARLAIRLMQGQSPKEIAEATRRSINTVRWTLKNVLAKADCHRQVDLVRLLRSGALAHVLNAESSEEGDE